MEWEVIVANGQMLSIPKGENLMNIYDGDKHEFKFPK